MKKESMLKKIGEAREQIAETSAKPRLEKFVLDADLIIKRVLHNEITADQAEAEAAKNFREILDLLLIEDSEM